MPLIDQNATETVTIGEDTFVLRRHLGFYDENLISFAGWDAGDEATPGEQVTARRLIQFEKRIASWSYVEDGTTVELEIIPDNLKLMPRHTADKLAKIFDEWAILDSPFRPDEDDAEADSSDEELAPLAEDA